MINIIDIVLRETNKERRRWKQYLNLEYFYERNYLIYAKQYKEEREMIVSIIQAKWNKRKLERSLKIKEEIVVKNKVSKI